MSDKEIIVNMIDSSTKSMKDIIAEVSESQRKNSEKLKKALETL